MAEFEPSGDFVERTMAMVRASEKENQAYEAPMPAVFHLLAWTGASGGALVGIAAAVRVYLMVLSPAVCH